jgi:hypothetical protein
MLGRPLELLSELRLQRSRRFMYFDNQPMRTALELLKAERQLVDTSQSGRLNQECASSTSEVH